MHSECGKIVGPRSEDGNLSQQQAKSGKFRIHIFLRLQNEFEIRMAHFSRPWLKKRKGGCGYSSVVESLRSTRLVLALISSIAYAWSICIKNFEFFSWFNFHSTFHMADFSFLFPKWWLLGFGRSFTATQRSILSCVPWPPCVYHA